MVASEDVKLRGTFVPLSDGYFLPNIWLRTTDRAATQHSSEPTWGLRVDVLIGQQQCRFTGVLLAETSEADADLSAIVKRDEDTSELPEVKGGYRYPVNPAFQRNVRHRTPRLKAVERLMAGHERTAGVDLRATCLYAPSRTENTPDSLVQDLADNATKSNAFYTELARHGLDEYQERAANLCSSSNTGYVLLHGPSGTGETKTCTAVVSAFVATGYNVLVTNPTGEGIDADIATFVSASATAFDTLAVCRFSQAHYQSEGKSILYSAARIEP